MQADRQTGNWSDHLLEQVQVGMMVFDRTGREVGKVEEIHFAPKAEDESVNRGALDPANQTHVSDTAEIIGADPEENMPETWRSRLKGQGYIRMSGVQIFGGPRYALAEQIDAILDGAIKLNVEATDLVSR